MTAYPELSMLASAGSMSSRLSLLVDLASLLAREVDLDSLLAAACERLAHALCADRATVWLVDAERGDLVGTWDPGRLAQVVSNLLGNAVKHGNRAEAIQIELDGQESASVRLVVSNAGGIPESSRGRLFEPFHGRETGSRPESGLGLGLYIVQQIVAAHGGSVEACCNEPERTAFVVRLPRSAEVAT